MIFSRSDSEEKVNEGVSTINRVYQWAKETRSRVVLYNHGGWAGESVNQVKIIEKNGKDGAGINFDFHLAHHWIGEFKQLLDLMMSYLYTVKLNEMNRGDQKYRILAAGMRKMG